MISQPLHWVPCYCESKDVPWFLWWRDWPPNPSSSPLIIRRAPHHAGLKPLPWLGTGGFLIPIPHSPFEIAMSECLPPRFFPHPKPGGSAPESLVMLRKASLKALKVEYTVLFSQLLWQWPSSSPATSLGSKANANTHLTCYSPLYVSHTCRDTAQLGGLLISSFFLPNPWLTLSLINPSKFI